MSNNLSQAKISITGLKCFAHHGVFPREKLEGQEFLLDLTIWPYKTKLVFNDSLKNTVSYAEICSLASHEFCSSKFDLIETAANHLCDIILNRYEIVEKIKVTVHKPNAPIELEFEDVSVTITKSKEEN